MMKKRLDKPNPIRAGGFKIGGPSKGPSPQPLTTSRNIRSLPDTSSCSRHCSTTSEKPALAHNQWARFLGRLSS